MTTHQAFHQSTQYNMSVGLKVCETVAMGGRAQSSVWNPLRDGGMKKDREKQLMAVRSNRLSVSLTQKEAPG